MTVRTLSIRGTPEQFARWKAWKDEVARLLGDSLSWEELMELYATDKRMRPKRAGREA